MDKNRQRKPASSKETPTGKSNVALARRRAASLHARRAELELAFWALNEALGVIARMTVTVALVIWLIHGCSLEGFARLAVKLTGS